MSRYKIGITEAGDAGIEVDKWLSKLSTLDGAILITKNITPAFHNAVLDNKDKLIIHATITGFGKTILEPNVPLPFDQYNAVVRLVKDGLPKERVVIRVDPIIPTQKGCQGVLEVIQHCMRMGFSRYRVSIIDMYPHVRKRFEQSNIFSPYGNKFTPSIKQVELVNRLLQKSKEYWNTLYGSTALRIESCAEPGLTESKICGCISDYDLKLLNLDIEDSDRDTIGYQRKNCLCYSGKIEMLDTKKQCPHQCLYCYWR